MCVFCGHLLNPSLKGIVVGIIRGRGSFLDPSTVASKELVKYSDQLCKLVGASSFFPPLFLVDESIADESRGEGEGGFHVDLLCHTEDRKFARTLWYFTIGARGGRDLLVHAARSAPSRTR